MLLPEATAATASKEKERKINSCDLKQTKQRALLRSIAERPVSRARLILTIN
jgi:hypothetical protein